METQESWIGQSIPRKEDPPLLTGAARYMDDLSPVEGIRYAAILRSPHGHAEILKIDVSAAQAMPGVIGVVTGEDVAGLSQPIANLFGLKMTFYPCARDRVRYYGEPVAVVVADNRYIAEDALDAIEIEYRPLQAVVDPEESAAAGAPLLHEALDGNVVHTRSFRYGEPEAIFAKATHLTSIKTRYPRVASTPIETFGVVAHFERAPDRYTVWSNFQGPFTMYPLMCAALKVPSTRLRLISPPASGGSFGIKQAIYPYIVLLAVVSRKLGVPVKWTEDRLEHLAASSCASERVVEMTGAFSRDGKLEAVAIKQLENVGAYLRPPEPAGLYRFHATLGGPYDVRHFTVENRAVVTNQMPSGLNRGYGGAQYCYPLERLMQRAAAELGIDPVDLRRRNLIPTAEFPYECVSGGLLESGDYHGALDLALKKIGIDEMRRMRAEARASGRLFGIGIACSVEAAGSNLAYVNLALTGEQRAGRLPKSGGSSTSSLTIDALGGIVVRIDGAPAGQGHETVVAQIVAEEIGVSPDDVTVVTELDTLRDSWSVSSGNYANRFSTTVVGAVGLAARAAGTKLRRIAAPLLDVEPEVVVLRNGKAYASGGKNVAVSIRSLAAKSHWDTGGLPEGVSAGISETATMTQLGKDVDEKDRLRSAVTYSFQCDIAAVEVDRQTGTVSILKYVTVHDAGRLLNPQLADGQIWGGFAHGLGAAMLERVVYGRDGTLLSTTFVDYMCPTAVEIPAFEIGHVTSPSPNTLFGAKGLGDGCSMLTPAVIANALDDALGIPDLVPPFTPDRIWSLLNGRSPERDAERRDKATSESAPAFEDSGVVLKGEDQLDLAAPPEQVWRLLFDVEAMRRILPGCRNLTETEPDHFTATIVIDVAGIGGEYAADIRVRDKSEPRQATLVSNISGRLGFGQGSATVTLAPLDGGTRTQLAYRYEAKVGGKVAGIGHRMLGSVVRVVLGEFFGALEEQITAKPSGFVRRASRRARLLAKAVFGR